jgi:hypothetical protein
MATKKTAKANGKTTPAVIVRTYSAGVHYGHLAEQSADGRKVTLTGAKRVWLWKGANTLHEMALRGVGTGSRVSERVESITLTEAIEVIACAPAGEAAMESASWVA